MNKKCPVLYRCQTTRCDPWAKADPISRSRLICARWYCRISIHNHDGRHPRQNRRREKYRDGDPTTTRRINPAVLAAAKLAGVDAVYQIGGAQAIAALAFGTESIPRVDKIMGPGNIFVATAKKQVFGQVAIDMIAGPSEIGVIADEKANARQLAADLLSQAEHDKFARPMLVTPSLDVAKAVSAEIERQLKTLPREEIARASVNNEALSPSPKIWIKPLI